MITPQQIDQISFSKSAFGGYNMEQVDEILEPLTEDYVTLYKENALLKSKMRVLLGKLEEYRKSEAANKDASGNARAAAEKMLRDTEAKCQQMLRQAQAQAAAAAAAVPAAAAPAAPAAKTSSSADALVAVEKARVAEARKAANARITEIQSQMQSCIQALDRIKNANVAPVAPAASAVAAPAPVAPAPAAPVAPKAAEAPAAPKEEYDSDAVADEISQNLEAMVGAAIDTAPKAAPQHPVQDTTNRFTNLNLQFGRNYDPTNR